ncbi:MAG: hypothetical protein IPK26_20410 [Planctomycetes bacterium]|nr:hypothetical protein [Planctomycetota bacterium]
MDGRRVPTVGTETELLPLVTHMGNDAAVAALLAAAQRCFVSAPAIRGGIFTSAGRLYRDCGCLLEVCSLPAGTLDAAWRQLVAVMAVARTAAADLRELDHPVRALICIPSDAPFRDRGPGQTQGHHVSYAIASPSLSPKEDAFLRACLHAVAAITGPGGFVGSPAGLRFVRDPRRAHVLGHDGAAARPMFRCKPGRIEVTCFGFTLDPIDVWLRLGLPWLALCAIRLRPDLIPEIRCEPTFVDGPLRVSWRGPTEPWPACDLLESLLDEVLQPLLAEEGVGAAGLAEAVAWARRGIAAVRHLPSHEVARRFPTAWALKAHAFQRVCVAAGGELPIGSTSGHSVRSDLLPELARAAVLADCVMAPTVLQRMAFDVVARDWELGLLQAPVESVGPVPQPCAGATSWSLDLHANLRDGVRTPVAWDLPG